MTYKLIATDMDNTLLNSQKKITEKNKQAIQLAKDSGIKVVLCSGRFHDEMVNYASELGLFESNQYMITNGGSIIEDCSGKRLYQATLSMDECNGIAELLDRKQISYEFVEINGKTFSNFEVLIKAKQKNNDLEIGKILFQDSKSKLDTLSPQIHNYFDDEYFVVRPGDEFLEIFPNDVNKGHAVMWLADYLNIDLKQVMTIGDMDNDIPMLKIAGNGVAMGNAANEVKQVSDVITLDNDHSGVGVAIARYALHLV